MNNRNLLADGKLKKNMDHYKALRLGVAFILLLQFCYGAPLTSTSTICSVCPPGLGVKSQCNRTVDTLCEPCAGGFYSNVSSAKDICLVCSKCGDGLFELHPCNATHDVFCELCSWTKATMNENYNAKCVESLPLLKDNDRDYVNTIPEHYDFLKGSLDDLMLGDQPMPDNDTQNQSLMPVAANPGKKNDSQKSPKKSNGSGQADSFNNSAVSISTSVPAAINTTTEAAHLQINVSQTSNNVIIDDDGSGSDSDLQTFSPKNSTFSDDDPGSGDATVFIGVVDTDKPVPVTTGVPSVVSTTTYYQLVKRKSTPSTLPPLTSEQETAVTTDIAAIIPIRVPSDNDESDEEEILSYDVGESKADEGLPVFAIIMAIVTTGIIFFLLGFIFNRRRSGTVTYTPSHKYKKAPTKAPAENNYHEMKRMNSSSPPAPEITYTDEDGKDRDSQVESKQDLSDTNGGAHPESVPMLPDSDTFPLGSRQSPINIDADSVEVDDTLEKHPLVSKYVPENVNTITNTGTTIKIDYDYRDSTLTGGPLGSKRYCLNHIEVHWGGVDSRGSEHTVNGLGYAAEIQLVHWNHDDCINYSHALTADDGLAILSVLVDVPAGERDHSGLKLVTDCLPSIQFMSESRHLPGGELDPKRLLPDNMCDYWTYSGSLTSPPYHQSVTWVVLKDHICVSHEQLERFRRLRTFERDEDHTQQPGGGFLVDNYRYVMPLNDRKVTASFI